MHKICERALNSGANPAYLQKQQELIAFCPDCAWEWINFLIANPETQSTAYEAAAIAIMQGAAVESCPKKRLAANSVQ